jgi:outer membrane lipoprotein-sorting protein
MRRSLAALLIFCVVAPAAFGDEADRARSIVRAAIDHWRGLSSYSEMTMIIHRPDWERSLSMRAWTEGDDHSLVRVTAPARDRGNATLMDDDRMWTFAPRINRVIKIPSSMMQQSWMGSDFSNKDVSRADDIIDQYDHRLVAERPDGDFTVYTIEAIPHESAAVVWGREVLDIRSDYVVLSHRFFDQDGELLKFMNSLEIGVMDGRTVALRQRMEKADKPDEWTELQLQKVRYGIEHPPGLFTLSNLRNPRETPVE